MALIVHGIVANGSCPGWGIDQSLLVSELIFIANKIAPPGSGVYRSWDCSRVDCVLVEANEIPPSGSGVNNCVEIDSQENLSCTWIDTCSRAVYGVGYILHVISNAFKNMLTTFHVVAHCEIHKLWKRKTTLDESYDFK